MCRMLAIGNLKERKKTDNPREGWEDGTPPPHRDFLRRGECGAGRRPPLGVCLFLSLFAVRRRFSLQPSCHPAVFLPSSFSLLSLLPLSRRSPLPRSAAPPPPVGPLLSRLLLPLGAVLLSSLRIVAPQVYQALTTGVSSSSSSSSPAASRSSLRSAWLTLHAVNIRLIHPIFFSRSSARALNLSLLRTHVPMAIEAAFPTTCSSLVTSPASSLARRRGYKHVWEDFFLRKPSLLIGKGERGPMSHVS